MSPSHNVLGVGISHAPAVERSGQTYEKPLQHMVRYLDAMDAAAETAPATEVPVPRILAALPDAAKCSAKSVCPM